MKIYFITGNQTKVQIANDILKKYDIDVIQEKIETPEIQAFDGKEVCEYSVKYANMLLKKPVVKTDVSYSIESLNGFPGPFVKYINKWLTAEQILEMLKDVENRKMLITEYLSYCDEKGDIKTFSVEIPCEIAKEIKNNEKGSAFDKITIREGTNVPQNILDDDVLLALFNKQIIVWDKLAEFVTKK